MIKRLFFALLVLLAAPAHAGDPLGPVHVSAGTIFDLGVLKSKYAEPRRVVVWLPPSYSPHGPKSAVLYMHDGQNLFDAKTASFGVAWDVGTTMDRLIAEGAIEPAIVVGIDNTKDRMDEYTPCCDPKHGGGNIDTYMAFIVDTVKPWADANLRPVGATQPQPAAPGSARNPSETRSATPMPSPAPAAAGKR